MSLLGSGFLGLLAAAPAGVEALTKLQVLILYVAYDVCNNVGIVPRGALGALCMYLDRLFTWCAAGAIPEVCAIPAQSDAGMTAMESWSRKLLQES